MHRFSMLFKVLQRHLHLLLPLLLFWGKVLILEVRGVQLVLFCALAITASTFGCHSLQFRGLVVFGVWIESFIGFGLRRVLVELFEVHHLLDRWAIVIWFGVVWARPILFEIRVNILFVVDFLEFAQKGIAFLGICKNRSDAGEWLNMARGCFALALLPSVYNHNFKLITNINLIVAQQWLHFSILSSILFWILSKTGKSFNA